MFAAFFGFDHSEPLALDFGAGGRAANHAEAVVDEPDHVIQKSFAVFAFLQPGFDLLKAFRCQAHGILSLSIYRNKTRSGKAKTYLLLLSGQHLWPSILFIRLRWSVSGAMLL
jgi:hypothetical protein